MKTATLLGFVLIVLACSRSPIKALPTLRTRKYWTFGPIQATKTEHNTIPLPPIVGGLALIGGIVLVAAGSKA